MLPDDKTGAAYMIRAALRRYSRLLREGNAPSLANYDGTSGERVFSVDLDVYLYERYASDTGRIRQILWWAIEEARSIPTPACVVCDKKHGKDYIEKEWK